MTSARIYDRETIRWEREDIDALVEAGRAQYFPGLPGYVIDKKIPVRNHQINEPGPVITDEQHQADKDYLRLVIADEPVTEEPPVFDEAALLAKFGA